MTNMRILGLDVGDRRIGVAISDPGQILASPLTTIVREDDDIAVAKIVEIVNKYEAKRIIIGLPYSMDGNIGKQANKVKIFAEKLSKCTEAIVEFRDERLSTVAVDHLLIEAGIKSQKKKDRRDAAAAAFILQGYLDSLETCD